MELKLERKQKKNMVGIRLTDNEFDTVERLAKTHNTSFSEMSRQLIRAALLELNIPSYHG